MAIISPLRENVVILNTASTISVLSSWIIGVNMAYSTYFVSPYNVGDIHSVSDDEYSCDANDTATTSTRSTPKPLGPKNFTTPQPSYIVYRSTVFEPLDFWSGESLKKSRRNNCENNKTLNEKRHRSDHGNRRSGRRRNSADSRSHEKPRARARFTRYGLVGAENSSRPNDISNETVMAEMKLNGYTMRQDMEKLMMNLKANISVTTIATTIEVHDIVLVQMSQIKSANYFRALMGKPKYVDEAPQKKIILIVHGLTAMGFRKIPCLYHRESFMKLVKMYARHLDKFDIFLMPMANPDGIADETVELWNKNKSPQSSCAGVAVDRNFDVHFKKNHSINPCSQQYPGPAAFSEPESRAVADLIHHYNHRIVAYIHVHAGSYDSKTYKGDAVLHPKGYKSANCDDDKYADITAGIEEVIRNAGFKTYSVQSTCLYKWYGEVYGTSVDYATTIYGIPFALEFVMQPYEEVFEIEKPSDEIADNVLTEVWCKVIDVVFGNFYKSLQQADGTDESTEE